jgi:hypothetical protein
LRAESCVCDHQTQAARYDDSSGKKKRCGDSDEEGRLYLCNRHELERLSRIRRYKKLV